MPRGLNLRGIEMAEIIAFGSRGTVGDGSVLDPDLVCENASGKFREVVVCGFNHDGGIEVRASHGSRETLWILHRAIIHLMTETE